ncbi:hypothetical protein Hanom_Chr15g01352321 [Helianthus anomalus]
MIQVPFTSMQLNYPANFIALTNELVLLLNNLFIFILPKSDGWWCWWQLVHYCG